MAHLDLETRVGAHRVFSAILFPSLVSPWSVPLVPSPQKGYGAQETLLVALSSFSSSAALLEKMWKKSHCVTNVSLDKNHASISGMEEEDNQRADLKLHRVRPSCNESCSIKTSSFHAVFDASAATDSGKDV